MPVSNKTFTLLLSLLCSAAISAQNVGIGTSSPHASAQLDIVSNNKGLSIPSMTTAQRTAIINPKPGLFVYDTNMQTLCMFNGANWVYFQSTTESNLTIPVGVISSDGVVGDRFGHSVDISGNYAVIGAPNDNIGANANQGSAYIFFFNDTTWVQQAKLTAANGTANDNFGYSVSINGDYVIIGAPHDDVGLNTNQGSAYIYVRSGSNWTQQANITGGSPAADDRFGYSVGISGSYCVAGAYLDNVGGNQYQGTAYFFSRTGSVWTQQDYVTIPSGAADDRFGSAVDISGNFAVIGAPSDDHGGETNAGSVHVFQRSGSAWNHIQTLTRTAVANGNFGKAVSMDGNNLVIGGSNTSGNAFVYEFNSPLWAETSALHTLANANPGLTSEGFGQSVSISGTYVITGKWNETNNVLGDGEAVLFQTDGTEYFTLRTILNPTLTEYEYMGYSVAVSGFYCVIGTPWASGERGKVYFLFIQ